MSNAIIFIPFAFGGNPASESGARCIKHVIDNNKDEIYAEKFCFEQNLEESPKNFLERLENNLKDIIKKYDKLILVGGNHLSILPLYRVLYQRDSKDVIITMDAHRDYYPDNNLNHASFLATLCNNKNTRHYLIGARDFDKHQEDHNAIEVLNDDLYKYQFSNITLLDIDVDVINPKIFPSCGCPIDGGFSFEAIIEDIRFCSDRGCKILSISEYIPNWDNAQTNAKMIFEMISVFLEQN